MISLNFEDQASAHSIIQKDRMTQEQQIDQKCPARTFLVHSWCLRLFCTARD